MTVNSETRVRAGSAGETPSVREAAHGCGRHGSSRVFTAWRRRPPPLGKSDPPAHGPEAGTARAPRLRAAGGPHRGTRATRGDVAAGPGSGSHGRRLSKASSRPLRWSVVGPGLSVLLKPSVPGPAALGLAPPALGATPAPAGPLMTTGRPGGSLRSERSPCWPTGPGHSRQAASVRAGGSAPQSLPSCFGSGLDGAPTQPCSAGWAAPAGVTVRPRP